MGERAYLILSAIQQDRPGLVAEVTGFIADCGCNVEDSRVVVLGGHAGLMFLISGTEEQVDAVVRTVEKATGVRAVSRRIPAVAPPTAEAPSPTTFVLTARAMDHEGIIHRVTDIVRAHGGNILELETSTESAPMSGSPLFGMRMLLTLDERYGSTARLREALDAAARAEAIDLEMTESAEAVIG